jgi:hypothetical protein
LKDRQREAPLRLGIELVSNLERRTIPWMTDWRQYAQSHLTRLRHRNSGKAK